MSEAKFRIAVYVQHGPISVHILEDTNEELGDSTTQQKAEEIKARIRDGLRGYLDRVLRDTLSVAHINVAALGDADD